jgi:N-acetylmuramoyl-L-alanine amidase
MRIVTCLVVGAALAVACGSCGGTLRAASVRTGAAGAAPAPAPVPTTPARPPAARPVPRPAIRQLPLPITVRRKRETVAYAERHYGLRTWRIVRPHVIVEHLTENDSIAATFNTFAPDVPDVELHELPGVCSQFVIGRDGEIAQLTPIQFMCRHTVGLNWTAIGIEHVGFREGDVLNDPAQLRASLRLTRWLRCRFRIPVADVIGHAESLGSPYHHERVAALRTQTHSDWQHWAMERYRTLLRRQGLCRSALTARSRVKNPRRERGL